MTLRGWLTGAAVLVGTVFVWIVLSGAVSALLLLFTAILFAAGLRPIVDRLAKRMPYATAAGLTVALIIVLVLGIGFVLVQPVGAELFKFVVAVPGYTAALQVQLLSVQRHIAADSSARQIASVLASGAGGAASAIGERLLSTPAFVMTMLGDAALIMLLAMGWLLSSDDLQKFVLSLMTPATRADWRSAFKDMELRLSAYVQGVVLNGTVVGVVLGASLALIGAPYAVLLGFTAAVFQAIPMVGAVLSALIILPVVLATSGLTKMLVALAIIAVVQGIDQNILSPIIFGQRVQMSFLLIILSTVVGGALLGIAGAFLAVPAASVLQIVVTKIVAPAIRRANRVEVT